MARRGKVKFFLSMLLLGWIVGIILLGMLFSKNQEWYALGRSYRMITRLLEQDSVIREGSAEFVISLSYERERMEGTGKIFFRKPDVFRLELDSSAGSYVVVNHESTWIHFKDRNAVLIADSNMSPSEAAMLFPRFVFASSGTKKDDGPLDLGPRIESRIPEIANYEITYLGRESLERASNCFSIHVRSRDPDAIFQAATIWIDPTTWLPAKVTIDGPVQGTVELFHVMFEQIPQDVFELSIPPEAQVQRIPRSTLLQLRTRLSQEVDA